MNIVMLVLGVGCVLLLAMVMAGCVAAARADREVEQLYGEYLQRDTTRPE